MAEWLNSITGLTVRTALDGERPTPGQVLFAPDNMHIGFSDRRRIMLTPRSAQDLYAPSVNSLFHTAARTYKSKALGVVLSGMGRDGATGLLEMCRIGAVTVAQNEETSVVYGMPDVAVSMGAASVEMSPSQMVRLFVELDERARNRARSYMLS
jgi:chemotaxis response regulator CheB